MLRKLRNIFANPEEKEPTQEESEWERAMLEQTFAPNRNNRSKYGTISSTRTITARTQGNTNAKPKPRTTLNTSKSTRSINISKDTFTRQPVSNETNTETTRPSKRF